MQVLKIYIMIQYLLRLSKIRAVPLYKRKIAVCI